MRYRNNMKCKLWLIWFLFGIILCSSVSIADLSDMKSIDDNFYNAKRILDCSENYYRNNSEIHDGFWRVEEDFYVNYLYFGDYKTKWKYICINIDEMNCTNLTAYLNYYNSKNDNELLYTQEIVLNQGNNIIQTACKKFDFMGVFIFDAEGTVLHVDSIQLRQKKPIENIEIRFTKRFVILFLIYIVFSLLLKPLMQRIAFTKTMDYVLDKIVYVFAFINDNVARLMKKISERSKSVVRIGIFFLMICYFNLTSINVLFSSSSKYRALVLSIMIVSVALLATKKSKGTQNWNTPIVRWWLLFNICTLISDVLVKKRLMFQGIVLLFVFGLFIYVWNNHQKKEFLLRELFCAIHLYFIVMTMCCFLFRPDLFIRYQGTFSNPVTFGAYAAIIAIVAFVEILENIKGIKITKRIVFYVIEFIVALSFVWKTQARSALLPIVLVVLFSVWKYVIRTSGFRRKTVCVLTIILLMIGPIYMVVDYIVEMVPVKLNTIIMFPHDGYKLDDETVLKQNDEISLLDSSIVYAEEAEQTATNIRFFQKFRLNSLEAISSGRTLFWKGYLRQMNLVGHHHYAYVMGKNQHPHNSLIMIAYRYGVFSVIPYIFILLYAVLGTFCYMIKSTKAKTQYVDYPFYIVCLFLSISLLDVAEYMYSGFGWVLFNMIIGILFVKQTDND